MKKSALKATTVRGLLTFVVIILIGLCGIGFYFAQSFLRGYAVQVGQTVADSSSSGTTIQSLKVLQQNLADRQTALVKANELLANRQNFQTQAINDINTYASHAGITISNYAFPAATTAPVAGTTPKQTITVTLSSPISYTKLLTFITEIEGNLPKMQVGSINLGRIVGNSENVTVDTFTVEVYTS